jgi:hypothetical protein
MVAASLRLSEQEFRELAGVPELAFSR